MHKSCLILRKSDAWYKIAAAAGRGVVAGILLISGDIASERRVWIADDNVPRTTLLALDKCRGHTSLEPLHKS